jgi:lipoyl(octanoyl) transferase
MNIQNWGPIDYELAVKKQLALVEDVASGESPNTLIFCSHNPVVTLGRGTKKDDVFAWTGPTIEVSRGGRATYHGPSQLVVYPIINLSKHNFDFPPKDLAAYLRFLEKSVVVALDKIKINSEVRTHKTSPDEPSQTGVWVGEKKIASIGIAVKKWVTYHGIAINIESDPNAFTGINPCGFQKEIMTCVEKECDLSMTSARQLLINQFQDFFAEKHSTE